jgi:glycerol-3-phosphate dehydrogenase
MFCVVCNLNVCVQKHFEEAKTFLQNEMGQLVNRASRDKIPINLSKDEIQSYIKRFRIIDKDHKGYVSITDIRRSFQVGHCGLIAFVIICNFK